MIHLEVVAKGPNALLALDQEKALMDATSTPKTIVTF